MPAGLKITLTLDEDRTLKELELGEEVPKRTKHRASVLRLNSRGWTVKAIADYLGWAESTVRQTIHRWNKLGLSGLWDASGRGKKTTWTDEDWQLLRVSKTEVSKEVITSNVCFLIKWSYLSRNKNSIWITHFDSSDSVRNQISSFVIRK